MRTTTTKRRNPRQLKTEPTPAGSKLDQIAALLGRADGASLAELVAATGWQAHSVRGALAGALKNRGLTVISEKIEGIRRYRVAGIQ